MENQIKAKIAQEVSYSKRAFVCGCYFSYTQKKFQAWLSFYLHVEHRSMTLADAIMGSLGRFQFAKKQHFSGFFHFFCNAYHLAELSFMINRFSNITLSPKLQKEQIIHLQHMLPANLWLAFSQIFTLFTLFECIFHIYEVSQHKLA